MREFFRGWKRKVGCVTLIGACVYLATFALGLGTDDGAIEILSIPLAAVSSWLLLSKPPAAKQPEPH